MKHDTQQFIRQIASIQPVQYLVKQVKCPGLSNIRFHPVVDDLHKITGIGCFFEIRTNLTKWMLYCCLLEYRKAAFAGCANQFESGEQIQRTAKPLPAFFCGFGNQGDFAPGQGKKRQNQIIIAKINPSKQNSRCGKTDRHSLPTCPDGCMR